MLPAEITRFVVLLAIFASVFLLIQIVLRLTVERRAHSSAVNRRLKMIGTGASREDIVARLRKNDPLQFAQGNGLLGKFYLSFRRNLSVAAVPYTAPQVAIVMGVIFAALVLVIMIIAWRANYPISSGVIQLILVFAGAVAIGGPIMAISFLAERRRKRMQGQFPVALDIFVRALRSGHPIAGALELLTQEMEDPIGSEFGLVADEVSYGADLNDALSDMADRWDLEDIRMFVVCLSVQSETGGNLAEILDNLSKVIRDRASLFLKVRALSSEGRMTGWLLTALPVITFVALFLLNPKFYLDVAEDPIFYFGFPIIVVWFIIGVVIIRKMVNIRV
ncbi:Flp pilus assembly protein TadB [Caenibius tardaugens NBRC 16725]|uniref:Flp pilus assembly protein TadB n=1 Tax=Caenibius tardaugens NBRC 16725 TaxID=1219035 RepID=U3A6W7_9SPHN|nr:type II secretion system F family protein [Caenibius tardaugens]AZI35421.1 type II secretion system F family protein [Caenibius tardaugens NBRC 16725]GAD50488.1 Flp pilus assembly protein TadB [Caenibius tardaugens NBRC 16725]